MGLTQNFYGIFVLTMTHSSQAYFPIIQVLKLKFYFKISKSYHHALNIASTNLIAVATIRMLSLITSLTDVRELP